MMFDENEVNEEGKPEDQNESSGDNLSQEFNDIMNEPIKQLEPSTAEKEDMQNFEQNAGNFDHCEFYLHKSYR
jgi:hypothetical protein